MFHLYAFVRMWCKKSFTSFRSKIFVCLCLMYLLFASGCSMLLRTAVNKRFPKRSLEEIRINNLQQQMANMERLTRSDVGVHVSRNNIDSLVDVALTHWFSESNGEITAEGAGKITLLSPHEFSLENQAVRTGVRVKVEFKKESKPGKIARYAILDLETMIIPVVDETKLTLTASVVNIQLKKLKLRGIFQLLWVVKPVLNSVFKEFRDNVNGYLAKNPIVVPLKIQPLPNVAIRDIISSAQLQVQGNPVLQVDKKFGAIALKIDKDGIDILADMVNSNAPVNVSTLQQRQAQVILAEEDGREQEGKILRKEMRLLRYHFQKMINNGESGQLLYAAASQNQLASGNAVIPKYSIPSFNLSLPDMPLTAQSSQGNIFVSPRRKNAKRLVRAEIPRQASPGGFDELFADYATLFNAKAMVGLDSFRDKSRTEILLSKQFIASTFNEVFADPQIALTYALDANFAVGPAEIKLLNKPEFNCSAVLENCNNRLSDCSAGLANCGFSCGTFDFLCHGRKIACNIGNGAKWTACQVANGGKYVVCQAENGVRFAWCSTVWLVEYLAYEALKIGTYSANINAHLDGNFALHQATLGNNIDSYSLQTSVNVDGSYNVTGDFVGEGLTAIFLCDNIHCSIHNRFHVSVTNPLLYGGISAVPHAHASDALVFDIPKTDIAVTLDNPLMAQFLSQCPGMFFSCRASHILVFTFALYALNHPVVNTYLDVLWKGRYNHQIAPFQITLNIPSMQLPGAMGIAFANVRKKSVSLFFPPSAHKL